MAKLTVENWHWIPGISVGPFQFGEAVDHAIDRFGLVKLPPAYPEADWDDYAIPDRRSRVSAEQGKIAAVLCDDELEYQRKNIIGMPAEELRKTLREEDRVEENIAGGNALYYDHLGVTIWMREGVVNGASCRRIYGDEE